MSRNYSFTVISIAEDRESEDPEDNFFGFSEVVVEPVNGGCDPDAELSGSGN